MNIFKILSQINRKQDQGNGVECSVQIRHTNERVKLSSTIIRVISKLGLIGLVLIVARVVMANQIPTTTSGTWSGTGTTAAATKNTPSGLRTTVSISGTGMTMGVRNNISLQTANTVTVPVLSGATNGIQVIATANSSCNNSSLTCSNLGTLTFNFADAAGNPIKVKNPVIHMSRLGGLLSYNSSRYNLGAVLSLTTPATGASLGIASGARGFTVTGNKISPDLASFPTSSNNIGTCTVSPSAPEAGCGSIPVIGTVSSLSFNVDLLRNNTSGSWQSPVSGNWAADGIYFTVSFDEDYGDAPASYDPTTAASHLISDLALGATIDADNTSVSNGGADATTAVTPSPNAVTTGGASNNGVNGDGGDEDAISTFPVLNTNSSSYSLTVPISGASSAGQVCGWIDLNRNNIFDNPTERACSSFASGATNTVLNWTSLSGLTAGNSYVRLRASYDTTGVQSPTGRLNSGEVEDYQIAIAKPYDYGDAPSSYGDAGHEIVATPTIYLGGTKPDQESGTQLGNDSGAAARGDDNDGNGDDEDAFTTLGNVSTIDNYDIIIPVKNTSGGNATLYAWVDFNKNGKFEATELKSAIVANNATSINLNWAIPSGTTPGDTYTRFRLTTTTTLVDNTTTNLDERSIGNVIDGEVEDYKVAIEPVPSLPPSSVGACEVAIANGSFESPTLTSSTATPFQVFEAGKIAAYHENDVPGWTSSADSYIELWGNGNFLGVPAHEGEQFAEINAYVNGSLYQDLGTTPGSVITWQFAHRGRAGIDTMNLRIGSPGATVAQINPANGTTSFQTGNTAWILYQGTYTVPAGQTTTRFEYQAVATAGGNNAAGNFIDTVRFGSLCDYGDAKSDYPVLKNNNGAAHINDGVTFLGSKVRIELDGQPSTAANGDDGVAGDADQLDDEEGVVFGSSLNAGTTASVDVIASVPGYLNAWIDFNQDNDWNDPGEIVFTDKSLNTGTNNLSFTVPMNVTTGNTFTRFRFSTIKGISPTGIVNNGEVEDYQIEILPAIASDPNLLLVKRITAINPSQPGAVQFDDFVKDSNTNDDPDPLWPDPNLYLRGAINAGKVKPGDEVEYTVYFLSNGDANAKEVKICDVVPDHMTFVKNAYGVELGIGLGFDSTVLPTEPNLKLSNLLNDDRGEFYAPGTNPPANLCKKVDSAGNLVNVNGTNNDNGAVIIKLPNLSKANIAGDPTDSYGFIRFRAKVK
jgi:uncharacterized repeat protein (TIGR01451 family)